MPEVLSLRQRLLRARTLHFVLGGLLLFFLQAGLMPRPPVEPVDITPEAQARLRAGWVAATGREPSAEEFAAELRRERDDEILFREALAAGLHQRDAVVRQRLIMNMRFLEPDSRADDDALVFRSESMGMHRNDLVVRRRLVQLMEFALSEIPPDDVITDAQARAMYESRREEWRHPARWRIRHVYFSAERRPDAAAQAVAAAEALNTAATPDPAAMGDPFLGGQSLPLLTANQLEGQFGSGFSGAIAVCRPSVWCAPVASGFGQHAVLIEEYTPERLPAQDEPGVRVRIASDIRQQRAADRLQEELRALRLKYGVVSP
jgi:hypothetical protein